MDKHPKGSVVVTVRSNFLYIQFPRAIFGGKQKRIALGIADTPQNRAIAQAVAAEVQADILLGRFDPTLAKYKPRSYSPPVTLETDIKQIFQKYSEWRSPQLAPSSRKIFRSVKNHLDAAPTTQIAQTPKLIAFLRDTLSSEAARRAVQQLNAACNWAIERQLIDINPFAVVKIAHKKRSTINPFTQDERDRIIDAFCASQDYVHYTDFVRFLFFSGCRPSEAIALHWNNIDHNLNSITFSKAFVEGEYKDTKTGRIRRFPINGQMRRLIEAIPRRHPQLVFPSPKSLEIDSHNFTNRAWQTVLEQAEVSYRPPYTCRHTFITLCLQAGVPVADVAEWVGNSPVIIYRHYAGLTLGQIPEI
ncbi:MAG: tyrosine-type recombinase/integrase [Jaaginema sp. PMC 1079.18]|nr:tyrosine-type recombinase/integrase [Jaaginema sp. PMC 1080.18]MEC4852017.1 tyrosine-type recombinase/integrase [Jaaginema sp. PMC 1079.18]MEC4866109.1 tyrosine-type recombinase/integrase [Jaaginema sp. PMC 1078.18]